MVEKFGSDQSQLATLGGGVISEDGAVLVSGDSNGSQSLLFGPAAIREIQTGVANGDWSLSPADATANISSDNPLPYWTFTDVSSAGAITAKTAVQSDGTFGLQWTVANGTTTGKSANITRYVPLPSAGGRSYAYFPELYVAQVIAGASNIAARVTLAYQYYTATGATTGTGDSTSTPLTSLVLNGSSVTFSSNLTRSSIPSDAVSMLITIGIETTATITGAAAVVTIEECRLVSGSQQVLIPDSNDASTYAPTRIYQNNGELNIQNNPGGSVKMVAFSNNLSLPNMTANYDKAGSADTTTITTAGTYYALTNAEVSFTPGWTGQLWLLTLTGYVSLNTTTVQYAFVRTNITDSSNSIIGSDLGFSRADNYGQSGRGGTVAFTKLWFADNAAPRKFKLYGTVQTTNGLTLSLAYTQMRAIPIG